MVEIMNPTYKTALKALMIIILICGVWWMTFELPSKQEVDEFLKYT